MKKAFLKRINWVLVGLIGLLGFNATILGCADYGVLYENYSVKNAVVDIEVNE